MGETLKVLAQSYPTANVLTDTYTVPGSTSAAASSIVVCNHGGSTTFRISVAVAGATDTDKQYLYYDSDILANDTVVATIGMTLGAGDVVRVYSANGQVSFNLFGAEEA